MRDTDVRAVLDAITEADPRYIWRLNGEFVNIIPKEAATDPDYYMNAHVEQFEVKDVPLYDAVERSMQLPATREFGPRMPSLDMGYKPTRALNPQVTISANDVTWRTLMNILALEHPPGVGWTARQVALPGVGGHVRKEVQLEFGDSSRVALPWEYPRPAMVPLRAAMEELGAAVHWLPGERAVEMRWGDMSLRVWVGSTLVALTGAIEVTQEFNLGATTELRDGRVWVAQPLVRTARGLLPGQSLPAPKSGNAQGTST